MQRSRKDGPGIAMVKLSLVMCCSGRDLRSNDETGTAKDT